MVTLFKKGRTFLSLLKETASRWSDDNAMRMAAALSYYTTFSLAPLLILVIAIVGLAFGKTAAQGHIEQEIAGLVGERSALAIQSMIQAAWKPAQGILASAISIGTLLFGAMGVLVELKQALNTIWRSKQQSSLTSLVTTRLEALGLILGIGFLMVVSLVLSAAIAAFGKYLNGMLPFSETFLHVINSLIDFSIMTGLFATLYKWLPETHIAWRDVWIGSGVTAVLFELGKFLIGLYIGKTSVSSSYGAAGSVLIILLWVYYSALILYFGAEFTALYAERYGSRIDNPLYPPREEKDNKNQDNNPKPPTRIVTPAATVRPGR